MADFVSIKLDKRKLDSLLKMLSAYPKDIPAVARNAVNDTANSARSMIVKKISAEIKIKQSSVRSRVALKKATKKVWQAWLRIKDTPLSLINFGARQNKEGVSFDGKDGRIMQERAFIALKNVWVREKKDGSDINIGDSLKGVELVERTPIKRLVGPSIAELYTDIEGLASMVESKAMANLYSNLTRHVNLMLVKRKSA
jgi:hypothetical protein